METLDLEVDGRIARITFTRPGHLNSISEQVIEEMEEVVEFVQGEASIRTLVIQGSGEVFSVGLDLTLLKRAFQDPRYFRDVVGRYQNLLLGLEGLDVPVVAVVNGLARAGGFELVLACDLVLVADEARLGDNHTNFGVMPGGGSTFRLPAKIGELRAKELILTARWLTGAQAVEYGLALAAVPRSELPEATARLCSTLVDKPRGVHAAVKRSMAGSRGRPFVEAVEVELAEFDRYVLGEEQAREGFLAYLEGRPPRWP